MAASPAPSLPSPVLGSAYLTSQSAIPPSSPSELGTSICLNLSLFKTTLKRYRALDDAITTRLNRDAALHRSDVLDVNEEPQRRTCLRIWADILESWKRREAVIRHCVSTVDDRLREKHDDLADAQASGSASSARSDFDRLNADRKEQQVKDELYTEQTRRQQLHNELTVESIVRRRTLAAFFSRCPDFQAPTPPGGGPAIPDVDLRPMPLPRRPINF